VISIIEMHFLKKHTISEKSNLYKLLGVCTDPNKPLCIITETLNGSILDVLNEKDINSESCVIIVSDIVSGMTHLHSENMIHCNLTARNILVLMVGAKFVVKIGDLRMAEFLHTGTDSIVKEDVEFPPRWSAPEVLTKKRLSKAADSWSFAVVLWEILSMEEPYNNILANREVIKSVCEGKLKLPKPKRISYPPVFDEIMQSCWNSEPSLRPNFEEMYKKIKKERSSLLIQEKPFVVSTGNDDYLTPMNLNAKLSERSSYVLPAPIVTEEPDH